MNTEDLMIGDWVNLVRVEHEVKKEDNVITHVGYNKEVKPIQITSIGPLGVHYDIPTFGPIYASKDEIEPIPVTPEILEKNGFEEVKGLWHQPDRLFRISSLEYVRFYKNCN